MFIPKLSSLNELRRKSLEQVEQYAILECLRFDPKKQELDNNNQSKILSDMRAIVKNSVNLDKIKDIKISVLLNYLDTNLCT